MDKSVVKSIKRLLALRFGYVNFTSEGEFWIFNHCQF